MPRRAGIGGAHHRPRRNSGSDRTGIFWLGRGPGARVAGKGLMFSRTYKSVVTVPPLLWITVFLLVPYAFMFCYGFWSVTPGQAIVHSWNFDNYKELLQKSVYWETLLRSMWIA